MSDTLDVIGLDELLMAFAQFETEIPKAVEKAMGEAAEDVTSGVGRIPILTGAAARSVTVRVVGPSLAVTGTAPYFGWLNFGGAVGRGGRIRRPFVASGRYIDVSLFARPDGLTEIVEDAVREAAHDSGLEMT